MIIVLFFHLYTGRCYCEMGYRGLDCSVDEQRNFTIACSNDCSGHGVFDIQLQTCQCQDGWLGRNCEDSRFFHQLIVLRNTIITVYFFSLFVNG